VGTPLLPKGGRPNADNPSVWCPRCITLYGIGEESICHYSNRRLELATLSRERISPVEFNKAPKFPASLGNDWIYDRKLNNVSRAQGRLRNENKMPSIPQGLGWASDFPKSPRAAKRVGAWDFFSFNLSRVFFPKGVNLVQFTLEECRGGL